MARCDVCGNESTRMFQVVVGGSHYTFDSIECAVHQVAPTCARCECRILGHGVEVDDELCCCDFCARMLRASA